MSNAYIEEVEAVKFVDTLDQAWKTLAPKDLSDNRSTLQVQTQDLHVLYSKDL